MTNSDRIYFRNIPGIPNSDIGQPPEYIFIGLDTRLPMYCTYVNQTISVFDELIYSKETVKKLNEVGLSIYLFEPLTSYNAKDGYYKKQFHGEFIGDENPINLRAKELDSISKLILNNRLSKVNVYTCDYQIEKHYPHYLKTMNLYTNDRFVKRFFRKSMVPGAKRTEIKKKFLNLNWRYTTHRHLVASYLFDKDSYISWPHKKSASFLKKHAWFDNFEPNIEDKVQNLYNNSPIIQDIPLEPLTDSDHDLTLMSYYPNSKEDYDEYRNFNIIKHFLLTDLYKSTFVSVVNESRFAQPTANFSEKTLQPILHKKPFILVAPPYTLEYLKEEYKFKTFDQYWSESYDTEVIHTNRLQKIFALIDEIQSKSLEDLRKIYNDMNDILNHNFQELSKRRL